MNKLVSIFGLAAISGSLGLMSACSSSSGDDSASGADSGSTDSSTKPDTGVVDSGIANDDAAGNDEACQAMATAMACAQCCIGNHASGAAVVQTAIIACGCNGVGTDAGADGGGPCASACAATLCEPTPSAPDAPCQTCAQGVVSAGGACATYAGAQCEANNDCVAEQSCVQGCPK